MEPLLNKALLKLSERAKELECLYKVEEAINSSGESENELFEKLLKIIPAGMQFSTVCEVEILYRDKVYRSDDYHLTDWVIQSDLVINDDIVGFIKVFYTQFIRPESETQFITEEQKLLDYIASRISCRLSVLTLSAPNKG